ncbi:MAG TPA: hypothetical protein VD865_01380 [Stenotrophomonas sp.]|nr:hypothetical protein [Stenotrophomonas sp.]
MRFPFLPLLICLLGWHAVPVRAADVEADTRNRVVVVENVKLDYAQVLNVEPVYQTLRASRTEEQCDPPPAGTPEPAPGEATPENGRISKMMDSVKDIFSRRHDTVVPAPAPTSTRRNCRVVEVGREFRRPIAYDVDYVYKGTKYRSRLPEDPGNRLRIRVSVTPYIPDAIVQPPR